MWHSQQSASQAAALLALASFLVLVATPFVIFDWFAHFLLRKRPLALKVAVVILTLRLKWSTRLEELCESLQIIFDIDRLHGQGVENSKVHEALAESAIASVLGPSALSLPGSLLKWHISLAPTGPACSRRHSFRSFLGLLGTSGPW